MEICKKWSQKAFLELDTYRVSRYVTLYIIVLVTASLESAIRPDIQPKLAISQIPVGSS